ncbi:MAG TPA: DUF1499 domain-containing protein [Vicinamibacteria bacterium]
MRRAGAVVGVVAVVVAAAALALLAAAGPGTRAGWWDFRTGLGLLRWVAYAGIAGAALGLVGLLMGGARALAAIAVVVALGAFAVPWTFQHRAQAVPPIHDITTDTEDPPKFVAVLARRAGAPNPPDYEGEKVAAQQKRAYPDLAPIRLSEPPDRAFERALQAARSLGWEIVAAEPKEGRIEATDTTRWFGFKDDIVIRVRPDGAGSRVDVRSESRVGRSDVGANAARIRRFRSVLGA